MHQGLRPRNGPDQKTLERAVEQLLALVCSQNIARVIAAIEDPFERLEEAQKLVKKQLSSAVERADTKQISAGNRKLESIESLIALAEASLYE